MAGKDDTPKKRKRGERDKLTPEIQRIIVKAISAGVPNKWAAVQGGITDRCLQGWLARGRQPGKKNEKYHSFLSAVKKAHAKAVAVRVARIGRAGRGGLVEETTTTTVFPDGSRKTVTTKKICHGDWTADAWYLERIHHKHFGRQQPKPVEESKPQITGDVVNIHIKPRPAALPDDN